MFYKRNPKVIAPWQLRNVGARRTEPAELAQFVIVFFREAQNPDAEIAGLVPDLDMSITNARNSPRRALAACKSILTFPKGLMGCGSDWLPLIC